MRHNNFDVVRLVSAFAVLLSHQFALTGRNEPLVFGDGVKGRSIGAIAVFVFFSISGYLVTQSWQRDPNALRFARNRLLRIWPALIVVVLLAALVLGPLAGSKTPGDYFASYEVRQYLRGVAFDLHYRLPGLFTANPSTASVNGSIWTIPVELAFYAILLVAAVAGVLKSRRVVASGAAALALYAAWQYATVPDDSYRIAIEFGAFFAAGATLSLYRAAFERHRRALIVVAIVAIVVGAFLASPPYPVLFAAIPVLAIGFGGASTPFLNRAGRFGDFSYGVYLYAFPVQQTIVMLSGNRLSFATGLIASAAITLCCAVLSWKLVEAPALGFKKRRSERAPT